MNPFQLLASAFGGFRVSIHNGSRSIHKQNQDEETTPVGSRRHRAGFSDSFSSHDLGSLDLEEGLTGSRRRVSEDYLRNSESEPVTPKASTSDTDAKAPNWRGFFRILKKGPQMPFQTFPPLINVPKLTRRKSKRIREELVPQLNSPALKTSLDTELSCFKASWKNFSLSELQVATDNFSKDNLIGEGGYAEVYKGKLENGQYAAIKRLTRGTQEEMTADFLSELGILVHVDDPNIAKVIGYGVEGGMHLVLHLSPHGSLSSILYGPREKLDWGIRYKIALGTAKGLLYLHEGCQRRIIHKDIKASNILLSEDFEPQISDFGLAKWLPDQWTHHIVSKFEGTFGFVLQKSKNIYIFFPLKILLLQTLYLCSSFPPKNHDSYLPPEFFMHGIVDEKTDVYSYGVLLLEVITGKPAIDGSQTSLVMWVKPLLSKNNLKELIDPCLGDSYDVDQMKRVVMTASMCINQSSIHRPQMSEVVQILEGDEGRLELLHQRQKSKLQRTYSEELCHAEEYNSTKYLSDLDRQLEFVLGPL
ncbi:receptor-like cytosolic serine/threonine-protein kinase RBK2 isoform X1 [Ziziphus jujuba]|uniref:Receptor-like cytosolic serine/threonine-protein kinase RBK2 isoform X1 n=1 Tax=Ziziphus jujuba TaxID=326968 RepID=A0ABM4A3I3_ZIZJJ|nr:receptor-like cytosolic serine/threonine-protein kinase RBK2 isoform X1 [Ziziphus jujuba]